MHRIFGLTRPSLFFAFTILLLSACGSVLGISEPNRNCTDGTKEGKVDSGRNQPFNDDFRLCCPCVFRLLSGGSLNSLNGSSVYGVTGGGNSLNGSSSSGVTGCVNNLNSLSGDDGI